MVVFLKQWTVWKLRVTARMILLVTASLVVLIYNTSGLRETVAKSLVCKITVSVSYTELSFIEEFV